MATYAAFKHVELHKVGYGKNRVPNAPRGRINEIFGGEGSPGGRAADSPVRPKDTHSRLFGPADPPSLAVRDHLRSNISFGEERSRLSSANGHADGHSDARSDARSDGRSATPRDGNPLSGEGYKSMNGEINTVTALGNSRVPPGGYSSGLW